MTIQGSLANHKAKLAAALEIHAFNRDVDDVNDRINEKVNGVLLFFVRQSLFTAVPVVFSLFFNDFHFCTNIIRVPTAQGNRENGQKYSLSGKTGNLEILPKHREFGLLKL